MESDGDAWRIYDYVVRHFIGTVSDAFIFNVFFYKIIGIFKKSDVNIIFPRYPTTASIQ